MKHLPNELLYLLKVYNYITYDIGLDRARSRAEDIRSYIAKADFLDAYPTVREYLSEDKSTDDIITYIERNRRTYELMQDWNTREISSHLSKIGIEGGIGFIGGFSVYKEGESAYFLLPDKKCKSHKIVLLNADVTEDIHTGCVLWLELYKKDGEMFLEIFDDDLKTYKVCFSALEKKPFYHSAAPLGTSAKTRFDGALAMSCLIFEKYSYDCSLLCEKELEILPFIEFFAGLGSLSLKDDHKKAAELFEEFGLNKANAVLSRLPEADSEKKIASINKKLISFLRSKKCAPVIDKLYDSILSSQENI